MTTKKAKGASARKRKPHNARTMEYVSSVELLRMMACEPRTVEIDGQTVTMPRGERLLRLMVMRALQSKSREIVKLLQIMFANPTIAATYRDESVIVFSGAFCHV